MSNGLKNRKIDSTREYNKGTVLQKESETRYYISDLDKNSKQFDAFNLLIFLTDSKLFRVLGTPITNWRHVLNSYFMD